MVDENIEIIASKYKMSKNEIRSLILVIVLQFVSTAVATMLIPSYSIIIDYFNIDKSIVGIPDSLFILVTAALSVFWGYYTDRVDRSKVVLAGAFMWSIGTIITAFNNIQSMDGFIILILARMLTGAAMGCVMPIGYSILADLIPKEERSAYFGLMAILNSLSTGLGQGISSFIGPLNILDMGWRFPFFLISIFSVIIIFLLFFIKLPGIGSHEEELDSLHEIDLDYLYRLSKKDIIRIFKKRTNLVIFIQAFFACVPGVLIVYFLTAFFADSEIGLFKELPSSIVLQVSSLMAALVGIGYILGNIILSNFGDIWFRKNKRNRALLCGICLIIATPANFVFITSAVPLSQETLNLIGPEPGIIDALLIIFSNERQYVIFLIFAFISSFFSGAPVANRTAVLIDLNLPEHRGTTTSFFNLAEQLGKGITLALSYFLFIIFPDYKTMIIFCSLFWLLAGFFWLYVAFNVEKDMYEKSMILKERTQLTFIDYIFELEILMDKGIQWVHDAKMVIGKDNDSAMNMIEKSINTFEGIERSASRRDMTDIISKAHNLNLKAIMLKTEFKNLLKRTKNIEEFNQDITQLKLKIDDWWDKSDFRKIEVLFESGTLKVLEARLNRKYDLFKTITILGLAIETFERVYALCKERLIDEEIKKLTDEEKSYQKKIKQLIKETENTKLNTDMLKSRLEQIVSHFTDEGVSSKDLDRALSLAGEYKVPYQEILIESIEKKKSKRVIESITSQVEDLFTAYDKWQQN